MEKRYRALRIISTLYKVVGVIVLAVALLSSIAICLAGVLGGSAMEGYARQMGGDMSGLGFFGTALGGIITAAVSLVGGLITGLSLYAMGEGISLAIAVEENTRATAMHVAALSKPAAPPPPAESSPFAPPPSQP
jgi:hypothetical protein